MKPTPLLTRTLGLTLLSLTLAAHPALHAKAKEKPALLCEQEGQMKPCEDSQSDKVADKGKPRAFKALASDEGTDKAKLKAKAKKKKSKAKKPRKPAVLE
ncbi:MAG: hypothetical protein HQ455_08075 [Burkholderiales bacterium]|jgi:hypothetical protein|nr:hypothetical protein [Burkholderiales bacterium]